MVMADPPLFPGADHVKPTCMFPGIAERDVGALGIVGTVIEFDAVDDALVPAAFVAVTVNVYVEPGVSPVTVIGEEVPFAAYVLVLSVTV